MRDSPEADNERTIQQKAAKAANGLHNVVGQASDVAWSAGAGFAELRQMIRAQPLTMAFLLLGLGYVVGRVTRSRWSD
jgi:hypothetical protein